LRDGNHYFGRHGSSFVRARLQNLYGAGEILGAGCRRGTPHTVWRNVTPTFIQALGASVDNGSRSSVAATSASKIADNAVCRSFATRASSRLAGIAEQGSGKRQSIRSGKSPGQNRRPLAVAASDLHLELTRGAGCIERMPQKPGASHDK
jgi:hypothetical protein